MITKETLVDFFKDLKRNGDFDATKPLLYGYFFTDVSEEKLLEASKILQNDGYAFADIFEADVEDDETKFFYLHVEKIEIHDANSLDKTNKIFYEFADIHNLESYDGFDVGNVE